MTDAPTTLLLGSGRLGTAVGLLLAERHGHEVVAVRRHADEVPTPLRGWSADLTDPEAALPTDAVDHVVVALTARPRTEEAYRAVYVDGMLRGLDAAFADGLPRRAVLVSSTAVFGEAPPDPVLDEDSPTAPADGPARVLLEAEERFLDRLPDGTVLRCSGLYGHGVPRLARSVLDGTFDDPHRWGNRIHRDDAASAVVHLLTMPDEPGPLYLGVDDRPTQDGEVAAHLADLLGAPAPPPPDPAQGHGRRLSDARLRSTGWRPAFPTFREGMTRADVAPLLD